jgi:23S rRNA maturation-related 3'-5' exoribonuclease YhaM
VVIFFIPDENGSSDSLMMLESRFQNVGQVVIRQEEEISKLNTYCRSLQIDLEKSLASQKILVQQQQELEVESIELQEFMQAEKTTLSDAMKDAENEIAKCHNMLAQKDKELGEKQEECKRILKLSEQRW